MGTVVMPAETCAWGRMIRGLLENILCLAEHLRGGRGGGTRRTRPRFLAIHGDRSRVRRVAILELERICQPTIPPLKRNSLNGRTTPIDRFLDLPLPVLGMCSSVGDMTAGSVPGSQWRCSAKVSSKGFTGFRRSLLLLLWPCAEEEEEVEVSSRLPPPW